MRGQQIDGLIEDECFEMFLQKCGRATENRFNVIYQTEKAEDCFVLFELALLLVTNVSLEVVLVVDGE